MSYPATKEHPGMARPPIIIAVMGPTGSGKSTFINLVSGGQFGVGPSLASCTDTVQASLPFNVNGHSVTLFDTPGFDDTSKSDTEVLRMIAHFLEMSYVAGTKLSAVLYLHRISDNRVGGIAIRNFHLFRKICGESNLRGIIIVTTMWDTASNSIYEARENELRTSDLFFKTVLDNGAQLCRHYNTVESAQMILRQVVDNVPMTLQVQRELVDEHKTIDQTAAGRLLNKELEEQAAKHAKETEELRKEMETAMEEKDEQTRAELARESRRLQSEMDRIRLERSNWEEQYRREREDMLQQLGEHQRQLEEERQEARRQREEEAQRKREEVAQPHPPTLAFSCRQCGRSPPPSANPFNAFGAWCVCYGHTIPQLQYTAYTPETQYLYLVYYR